MQFEYQKRKILTWFITTSEVNEVFESFNPISPGLLGGGVKSRGGTMYHNHITFEEEPLEG